MSDTAASLATPSVAGHAERGIRLDHKIHPGGIAVFFLLLVCGLGYAGYGILTDTHQVGETLAIGPLLFLGLALIIALGFEFVNGFHDTANAVATVIYTHSLSPITAVIWSGVCNFTGVVLSGGAVAYSVITLLPVELILQVGSGAGYAMIFALLIAAIIWNLGTWALGLPNSSSHALIGSIMGVGLANQLMAPGGSHTAGVDWGQAKSVLLALLVSPPVGFLLSGLLLLLLKSLVRSNKALFEEADPNRSPPWSIRGVLIATCSLVSFAHGGNDGQKGMGLIMLILIGVAPTAYALNRTMPDASTPAFVQAANQASAVFARHAPGVAPPAPAQARTIVDHALDAKQLDNPQVMAALSVVSADVAHQVESYGALRRVPAAATPNLRNEMYMEGEAIRQLTGKDSHVFTGADAKAVSGFRSLLNAGTRYIPDWVKVTVAIALGLGTMVGWKRIVVTVGERIGKQHLSYGQGASAELVAAATIGAAEWFGMPVSTTHVLSSGVAGTMAANGSGLQWSTVRNIAMAWVLTLPAAILIAGSLYAIFRQFV